MISNAEGHFVTFLKGMTKVFLGKYLSLFENRVAIALQHFKPTSHRGDVKACSEPSKVGRFKTFCIGRYIIIQIWIIQNNRFRMM